jgi:fluoroacetyl-CoA thioesterase
MRWTALRQRERRAPRKSNYREGREVTRKKTPGRRFFCIVGPLLLRAMAKPVPIGARGEAEETVEFKHTLSAHHPELPPVYSTPDMIRLMETAAFHATQPYCEGDEITVGSAINVEHRAPSGIGARIRAEAIVESFDGRFYKVKVSARDDVQEIGRGTVGRAVVSVSKFLESMKKRSR